MKMMSRLIVLGAVLLLMSGCSTLKVMGDLDPKAGETYGKLYDRFIESGGDIGAATVWRMKVQEGVTKEDIAMSLESARVGTGLLDVGQMPLSEEIKARTGRDDVKYLKIYQYCNPITAEKMVDYSPYFSAYLPCRIAVAEDENGDLWLYSLDMDMMIHGGRELPPEMKKEAGKVRDAIWNMMESAASGGF